MSEAPDRIWLQWGGPYGDNTFCEDQINSDDVEYIRADLHQKALDRIEELEAEVGSLKKKEIEEVMWRVNHIEELEAENKRQREALQKCADPHRYHAPCPHCCQTITECGSYIARAALKGVSDEH